MERDARERTGRSGQTTLPAQLEIGQTGIIHMTAAAAAKAAATALLTNQVVRRVRVSLLDGRKASFKVDKCVLESGSALCSVVGTRFNNVEVTDVPEICVRVAWEEEPSELHPPTSKNNPILVTTPANAPELLWLELDQSGPQKPSNVLGPLPSAVTTELDGLVSLAKIPLFLHFDLQTSNAASSLKEIPRELLAEAVREALVIVPVSKLGQGVRVFVSLVNDTPGKIGLPHLQVGATSLPLLETSPVAICRLVLALDSYSSPVLPMLVNNEDEHFVDLPARSLNLKGALDQLGTIAKLNTLTIGGSPATAIALASGNFTTLGEESFNNDFLVALAQRRDLDSFTLQSLRDTRTVNDLVHLISRRRMGWLFDEICRVACLEIRKRLTRALSLEMIIFGSTGAILGRSLAEPASFHL